MEKIFSEKSNNVSQKNRKKFLGKIEKNCLKN